MPDIIEENEGDGNEIRRRAHRARAAAVLAQIAAENNNNNNNQNQNNQRPVAVPAAPAGNNNNNAVPAAAAAAAPNNDDNNNNNEADAAANAAGLQEVAVLAGHMARLVGSGVNVRPMFHRLGVERLYDVRYIRERDLDGIPRISVIQKRKLWALAKYVATDHAVTASTTLTQVARTLNLHKKRDKDSTSATHNNSGAGGSPANANNERMTVMAGFNPLGAPLDPFDGAYSNWVLWNQKTRYGLAQTCLAPLLSCGLTPSASKEKDGSGATKHLALAHAKRFPRHDYLLFNMLAQAIVGGSAKHLIRKAEHESREESSSDTVASAVAAAVANEAAASSSNSSSKKKKATTAAAAATTPPIALASGRKLWQLLQEEYTQGPMAFWIISDARQILQKLHLVSPSEESKDEYVCVSAQDFVSRFRAAKETLEDYHQELPDSFLAYTFVEHIQDDRLKNVQQQLIQDLTTKQLTLEQCIKEVLMADHMGRARSSSSSNRNQNQNILMGHASAGSDSDIRSNLKRPFQEEEGHENDAQPDDDNSKRLKMGDEGSVAARRDPQK